MIIFKDFQKKYKSKVIIEKTSFEIPSDKIVFFMAPNGYGKTTLIKCLAGLEKYDGEIIYESGIDKLRAEALVIWDDSPFYEQLSGIDNLIVFSERSKVSKKDLYNIGNKYLSDDILNSKVSTYSYGQKKKLALALQSLLSPELSVMDEISNGLDYDSIKYLKSEAKNNFKSKYMILTGHQFSFYEGIVDMVFIIKDKKIFNVSDEYSKENVTLADIYERYFGNE